MLNLSISTLNLMNGYVTHALTTRLNDENLSQIKHNIF